MIYFQNCRVGLNFSNSTEAKQFKQQLDRKYDNEVKNERKAQAPRMSQAPAPASSVTSTSGVVAPMKMGSTSNFFLLFTNKIIKIDSLIP